MVKSKEALEAEYIQLTPGSRAQWERGRSTMPGGIIKGAYWLSPHPVYMDRGEGCYLWDIDGRQYVDFANNHTAMILGHSPPAVVRSVQKYLENGIVLGAPSTLEAEIAEEIHDRVPSVEKVRFTNSGTEASLHATRLVRSATGKPKIAKFEGAYHGSHDAVEISGRPPVAEAGDPESPESIPDWEGFARSSAEDTVVLPYGKPEAVEMVLREHKDEIAAVFYDAKAGSFDLPDDFTRYVRRITEELGLLMVMDEVISFRMARGGFQQLCGIEPDLTIFGKVVGGGLPVGALGGRADLMDLLDNTRPENRVYQSGTYSGNVLTLAAGLANLRSLTPAVYRHLDRLGERLHDGMVAAFARAQVPAQVVSRGSISTVYLTDRPVTDYRSASTSDGELTHRLVIGLLIEGYFTGVLGGVLSEPMRDEHIDGLIDAIGRVLEARD